MDVARTLQGARRRARLTQADLARRSGTSQATLSAYETGRKQPSVATLTRILAALDSRLEVVARPRPVVVPSSAQHAAAGRALLDVLALAAALPTRHAPELRFPRLPVGSPPA